MATVGALGVFVSALLPWGRSGQARRSGFELARTADSLDLATGIALRVLLVAAWFVPLLAAVTWTAAALRRPVAVALAAALTGGLCLAAVVVVARATVVRPEIGLWTGMVAGIVALTGAVWLALGFVVPSSVRHGRRRVRNVG
jgi:hypothetical protein